MSLNICIRTIPHEDQRYATVGDWYNTSGDNIRIAISNMGDWRKEIAVAMHELIEYALCRERNISQDDVDDFDRNFEARRLEGNTDEPGDDPSAPYHYEHQFATIIERAICLELGLDWKEYEKTINSL